MSVLGLIVTLTMLPETKGKSLEELTGDANENQGGPTKSEANPPERAAA